MSDVGSTGATVAAGAGDTIVVTGCLDVNTVAACRDEGVDLLPASGHPVVFDLRGAEVRGSAVIALLIAWQRAARARRSEMSVTGASESLLQIADACGVRKIIPFTES